MIKQSILMVDDRDENLLALERLLEDMDLDLVKASSGNKALELLLDHDFALILLDVQMPEMDGYEVAGLLGQFEKTKHIPVIFVTANSVEESYMHKAYESGGVDYVVKPINPLILRSKVRIFAQLHRQRAIIEKQLGQIKRLAGLLPICSCCKKIRNDTGYWEEVEEYVGSRSDVDFSHSICPVCIKKFYPEDAEHILGGTE